MTNFHSPCYLGRNENLAHIYERQQLNKEQPKLEFEQTYSENVGKIRSVYERIKKNMNKRDNQMNLKIGNQKENFHETIGPLFPVFYRHLKILRH